MTPTSGKHPQRCETCGRARKQIVPTATGEPFEFWYCPITKKFLHDEFIRDKFMEFALLVGCASHSSASEQHIQEVIEELERKSRQSMQIEKATVDPEGKAFRKGEVLAFMDAISLLRDGEKK